MDLTFYATFANVYQSNMKHIAALISFILLFLLSGEVTLGQPSATEGGDVVPVSCTEGYTFTAEESLLPVSERLHGDMILTDYQTIARQISVRTERMIRLGVVQSKLWAKALMRGVALCDDEFTHHTSRRFTSIRRKSWSVASDYYVFGMRHILI